VASSYDVIAVGPGKYNESVSITTPNLSILGAQAGRDARMDRNDPSKESIVDATNQATGPGGGAVFYVGAPFVVIDGFTIQGGTGGVNASGIYVYNQTIQILNNIIQNNAVGVFLYHFYWGLTQHNFFKANNNGAAGSDDYGLVGMSGFGIAANNFDRETITENAFTANLGAAMWLCNSSDMAITQNRSEKDGSFVVMSECQYIVFGRNSGRDFGAKGFLPVVGTTDADGAIDLLYYNYGSQIIDNDLEGGKAAGYNGIAFTTIVPPTYVCEWCHVTNNTIKRFAGNGIVADSTASPAATLYLSIVSRNDVEDNGKDGILIGLAPYNGSNSLLDNNAEGNHVFDCVDDTTGTLALGTNDTWYNNIGSLSSPNGLCTPGKAHDHD
jgi:hypothetical protein